jgi:hypothetical protein
MDNGVPDGGNCGVGFSKGEGVREGVGVFVTVGGDDFLFEEVDKPLCEGADIFGLEPERLVFTT